MSKKAVLLLESESASFRSDVDVHPHSLVGETVAVQTSRRVQLRPRRLRGAPAGGRGGRAREEREVVERRGERERQLRPIGRSHRGWPSALGAARSARRARNRTKPPSEGFFVATRAFYRVETVALKRPPLFDRGPRYVGRPSPRPTGTCDFAVLARGACARCARG